MQKMNIRRDMKKTHNNFCKGCSAVDPDNINLPCMYLFCFKTNQDRKCPCSNCLVKVMCRESCSELSHIVRKKYRESEDKNEKMSV